MNRTKILLGTSALVLTVAGAFAKMHKSTAPDLYITTGGSGTAHCRLVASSPNIVAFTTGAGTNQAKIVTNGGVSRLVYAESTCATKVYFKP